MWAWCRHRSVETVSRTRVVVISDHQNHVSAPTRRTVVTRRNAAAGERVSGGQAELCADGSAADALADITALSAMMRGARSESVKCVRFEGLGPSVVTRFACGDRECEGWCSERHRRDVHNVASARAVVKLSGGAAVFKSRRS